MWRYDPGIYGSNMISENCFVLYMPMILSGIRNKKYNYGRMYVIILDIKKKM